MTTCNFTEADNGLQTLQVMLVQEKQGYRTAVGMSHVNKKCRAAMVFWCFQVIQQSGLSRELVAMAMSYLDRFLIKEKAGDSGTLQLAVMTCLYVAIKVHGRGVSLRPDHLCDIAGNAFSRDDVIKMESRIVETLEWRLNSPTPLSFLHCFVSLLPDKPSPDVVRLSEYQTQVAVLDFVGIPASTIALCALANALEATTGQDVDGIKSILSIDPELQQQVQDRLWNMIHISSILERVPPEQHDDWMTDDEEERCPTTDPKTANGGEDSPRTVELSQFECGSPIRESVEL